VTATLVLPWAFTVTVFADRVVNAGPLRLSVASLFPAFV
jgi:hypothetical protein